MTQKGCHGGLQRGRPGGVVKANLREHRRRVLLEFQACRLKLLEFHVFLYLYI